MLSILRRKDNSLGFGSERVVDPAYGDSSNNDDEALNSLNSLLTLHVQSIQKSISVRGHF